MLYRYIYHIIAYHLIAYHLIAYHLIAYHLISRLPYESYPSIWANYIISLTWIEAILGMIPAY